MMQLDKYDWKEIFQGSKIDNRSTVVIKQVQLDDFEVASNSSRAFLSLMHIQLQLNWGPAPRVLSCHGLMFKLDFVLVRIEVRTTNRDHQQTLWSSVWRS